MLGIVKANLKLVKSGPKNLISKKIIGIFIDAQTQRNVSG